MSDKKAAIVLASCGLYKNVGLGPGIDSHLKDVTAVLYGDTTNGAKITQLRELWRCLYVLKDGQENMQSESNASDLLS